MPFVSGLDLGKIVDHSAIAVLEQSLRLVPGSSLKKETHYFVGYLRQWPTRTPYVTIVTDVRAMYNRQLKGTQLAIDKTGVGVAVVESFQYARLPCVIRPITITSGHEITEQREDFGYHVPKKELVSNLEVLIQAGRLTIATEMPHATTLRQELSQFQMKVTRKAHESFGTWRDGQHDDLVLAVMMAAWLGETVALDWDGRVGSAAHRNEFHSPPEGTFLGGSRNSVRKPPQW